MNDEILSRGNMLKDTIFELEQAVLKLKMSIRLEKIEYVYVDEKQKVQNFGLIPKNFVDWDLIRSNVLRSMEEKLEQLKDEYKEL